MIILAIETSCDETAISILKAGGGFRNPRFEILSNIVSSQVKIHAQWGGVVPNLAKREHQRNLPIVLKKALAKAKISFKKINLIAVTVGPGLEPALWTGINFAKDLAEKWNKPLLGINHLEGHTFSVFLKEKGFGFKISDFGFPAVALLVSGGHTELVLIKDWLKYKIIGQTRDDAAGEAFDKVAKMLGLSYPGGPAVAKMATKFKIKNLPVRQAGLKLKIHLPRPMINSKDYDFSFSGLKTAVLYLIKDFQKSIPKFSGRKDLVSSICCEFQQAVIDVLIKKTIKAAKEYKVRTLILGGGVAANKELRRQLQKAIQQKASNRYDRRYMLNLVMPEKNFTTDNAAMIAAAAYFRGLKKSASWRIDLKKLKADGNLTLK